jgi:hypothetical protein
MHAFLRRVPPHALAYGLFLLLIGFALMASRNAW